MRRECPGSLSGIRGVGAALTAQLAMASSTGLMQMQPQASITDKPHYVKLSTPCCFVAQRVTHSRSGRYATSCSFCGQCVVEGCEAGLVSYCDVKNATVGQLQPTAGAQFGES